MKLHLTLCLLALSSLAVFAQQVADPHFDAKVARPAYTAKPPQVLFDEAHHNFHTMDGRYQPFAALLRSDGCRLTPKKQPFSKQSLAGYQVLVIANALGGGLMNSPEAARPAFTEEECDAVRAWVYAGGALLLVADHAPAGAAAERLSLRFGVEMSKGYTADPANFETEADNQGFIKFNRANGLLGEHAITRGRNANERLNYIQSFTGQSLKGPTGSVAFLKLADTALDVDRTTNTRTSAAGRAQGVALRFGKGRVVVMGEAAMLSAQLAGPQQQPFGMNRAGLDNRQLVLNIVHWLTGLLK